MTNNEVIDRLQKCIRNLEFGKATNMIEDTAGADERIMAYEYAIKAINSMEEVCEAMDLEYDGFQILRIIKQICEEYKESNK